MIILIIVFYLILIYLYITEKQYCEHFRSYSRECIHSKLYGEYTSKFNCNCGLYINKN